MTRETPNGKVSVPTLSGRSLRVLAARLRRAEEAEAAAILQAVLVELRPLEVVDLWEPQEAALTYWVLMLTGVNQPDELNIARDLLAWQAFFAKDSARVLCLQSSERDAFRCCSSAFEVHDCPSLVMSDTPEMQNRLKVEADLLRTLAGRPGELQRFLSRLHALVENGRTLNDLDRHLTAATFWRGLKVVYQEVKDLVSITISSS